jgi:outer membrane protein with beta-barrel domain
MRNMAKSLAAAAALLLLVSVSVAQAQRRRGLVDVSPASERHGFWLSAGLAAGTDSYKYENVPGGYGHDLTKPSLWFALGGTVSPHLRLGGEVNAWINEYQDSGSGYNVTETLVGGLLTGQVYPVNRLGLFFKGGLGISRSAAYVSGGDDTGETGFAYLGGAGYEIRLGRSIFLTPAVNVMYHRSSPGRDALGDPDNLGGLRERVFTVGVGITFQPGR